MLAEYLPQSMLRLKFSPRKRIEFYRALLLMDKSGTDQRVAVERVKDMYSSKSRKGSHIIALVAEDALHGLNNGLQLHNALEDWIPPAEVSLLAAGHEAADTARTLGDAIMMVKRQRAILAVVLAKLTYPVVLVLMLGVLLSFASVTIVPQLIGNRPNGADFEGAAWILYTLSWIVSDYGIAIILGALAFVAAVAYSLPNWTGPLRVYFDKIPPWSIYREVQGAMFLTAISVMQRSGADVERAVEEVAKHADPWLAERMEYTLHGLRRGENLGESLVATECDFPSEDALPFLRVLTAQPNYEDLLADFTTERMADTEAAISNACAALSMLALIGITLVAATMYLGLQGMATITN